MLAEDIGVVAIGRNEGDRLVRAAYRQFGSRFRLWFMSTQDPRTTALAPRKKSEPTL